MEVLHTHTHTHTFRRGLGLYLPVVVRKLEMFSSGRTEQDVGSDVELVTPDSVVSPGQYAGVGAVWGAWGVT